MSEPMFGAGATATAERPAPAPEVESPSSGGNRKMLLALGGVVAALVVAGLAFFFLTSSGGDDADNAFVPPAPRASAPAPAPSAAAPGTPVKPATITPAKRDPFAPLFPTPAASTAPDNNPSAGASTPVTQPSTEPSVASVTMQVTSIDSVGQTANLVVDSKKFNKIDVGTTFGTYYTLYSIFNEQCVGVLYGDQNVPVCLGKPVNVTP